MADKALAQGVAVVTGAAGGMGSACVRQLARAGWSRLLLCDISEERLEAVARPLRDAGNSVDSLTGDIADPAFPAKVIDSLKEAPIAALVHTAGISPLQGEALRIIDANLDATVRLIDAVHDSIAPGSAAILFASNSSYFPMPPEAAAAFTASLPPEGAVFLLGLGKGQCPSQPRRQIKRQIGSFALPAKSQASLIKAPEAHLWRPSLTG